MDKDLSRMDRPPDRPDIGSPYAVGRPKEPMNSCSGQYIRGVGTVNLSVGCAKFRCRWPVSVLG